MPPAAVGTVDVRGVDDKEEGAVDYRSRFEALLRSFNFTPEQEAELPAIRQGAERLLSNYERMWQAVEPGRPLAEVG